MKIKYLLSVVLTMCAFTLFGCGGGGGGSATTTLTGVASKGIFVSGIVKVFKVNPDGTKADPPLTTADIQPDGTYTAKIAYEGPVVVEASGKYKDEASGGSLLEIPPGNPMRAVVANAKDEVKVAITALTEIATQKVENSASKKIDVAGIDAANKLVSDTFHVANILTTQPIDPLATPAAGVTDDQKQYALALAAVSQIMHDNSNNDNNQKFQAAITTVKAIVDSNSTQASQTFQAALQTFATGTSNKTGINDVTATPLINIGGSTATIKLKTVGSGSMNGIQVTVTLPAGVTVKAVNGIPLSGLVAASGVVSGGSLFEAHYLLSATEPEKLIIALASKDSFAVGEVATIKCDVAGGVTLSAASFTASSFTNVKAVDGIGASVANITIAADVI